MQSERFPWRQLWRWATCKRFGWIDALAMLALADLIERWLLPW